MVLISTKRLKNHIFVKKIKNLMQIFIELQIIRLTTTIKIMTVLYVAPQNTMNVHDRESGSSMQAE